MKHGDYPAVIKGTSSDEVAGFLIIPNSPSQWKKIDDFEGEVYRRHCVQICLTQSDTTVAADVCLWAHDLEMMLEEDKEWSFPYFKENRLQDWLELLTGWK